MSLFKKPEVSRSGVKVLFYGLEGSGKTVSAITFPGVLLVDTEAGSTWYMGTELGKNVLGVFNTQSYRDIQEAMEEVTDTYKDSGVETFVIDSMTKVRQGLVRVVSKIDEKRERSKGKSALEANTSMRSWGKIGQISSDIQNDTIDLSTNTGVNVVHTAQAKAVYEGEGDNAKFVGYRPDVHKSAPFDYDIIVYFYKDDTVPGKPKFYGKIEKDRLNVFLPGDVVENVGYHLWAEKIAERSGKKLSTTSYQDQIAKDEADYEESEKNLETPLVDRFKILINENPDSAKEIVAALNEKGVENLGKMNASQAKVAEKIYGDYYKKLKK